MNLSKPTLVTVEILTTKQDCFAISNDIQSYVAREWNESASSINIRVSDIEPIEKKRPLQINDPVSVDYEGNNRCGVVYSIHRDCDDKDALLLYDVKLDRDGLLVLNRIELELELLPF